MGSNNIPRTAEQERIVVGALLAGKSGREAARLSGLSPSSVSNIVRKYGIGTKQGRRPTCEIDHAVFDTLNEESEYWAGFLFADGSITDDCDGAPQLHIGLAEVDRKHIENFRRFCKSTHAIINEVVRSNLPNQTTSTPRNAVRFGFRSKRIAIALRRLGLFSHKSEGRNPSPEIENSVHFWRGCVDGDGTIRINEDKRYGYKAPCLILCGHMSIMLSFQRFLQRHGTRCNIHPTASGIFYIRLANNPALRIIRLLYGNAKVALDRKHATAKTIMEIF